MRVTGKVVEKYIAAETILSIVVHVLGKKTFKNVLQGMQSSPEKQR
jgi:hypothetical protein